MHLLLAIAYEIPDMFACASKFEAVPLHQIFRSWKLTHHQGTNEMGEMVRLSGIVRREGSEAKDEEVK